jgi:predicted Holliday junction resolvase-like endonuclease
MIEFILKHLAALLKQQHNTQTKELLNEMTKIRFEVWRLNKKLLKKIEENGGLK